MIIRNQIPCKIAKKRKECCDTCRVANHVNPSAMFTSGHVAKDGTLGPWSCAAKRLYTVTLINYTLADSSGREP